MRLIILTSSLRGTAAHHLPTLAKMAGVEIVMVVFSHGQILHKKRHYLRKWQKILKIGPLGAWIGKRMRAWYKAGIHQYLEIRPLDEQCADLGLRFETTPTINCQQTRKLFEEAGADLGLSLGNGYIGKSIFSKPKFGMINIHHEQLPAYQNAQSIIWQIYNGSDQTGYTIHKIDQHIDTGEILMQETLPITWRETLADTVSFNYAKLLDHSAAGLQRLLQDFENYYKNGKPQGKGGHYTTPTIGQYLKIRRQFEQLRSKSIKD